MNSQQGVTIARSLTSTLGMFSLMLCAVTGAAHASTAPAPVTAQPLQREVSAGKPVIIQFTTSPPYIINSCSVDSRPSSPCAVATPATSATASVTLAAGTEPGPLTLRWSATLYDTIKEQTLPTPARGQFTIAVHPPTPHFTVTANRESGPPGTPVTVSFTTPDHVTIRSCNVRFAGQPYVPCGAQSGVLSAVVRVPADAGPGTTTIEWNLVYAPAFPDHTGSVPGKIPFRVSSPPNNSPPPPTIPPSPPPGDGNFSVTADTAAAVPGQTVHVWFRPFSPNVGLVGCAAWLGQHAPADCTTRLSDFSVELHLDREEKPGPLPIHWTLSYSIDGQASRQADGDLPLTVIVPPRADDKSWFTSLGSPIGILAAILAAGAAWALRKRKPTVKSPTNDGEHHGQTIITRTRAGVPRVSIRNLGTKPTRNVRVAVRVPAPVSTIRDPQDSR